MADLYPFRLVDAVITAQVESLGNLLDWVEHLEQINGDLQQTIAQQATALEERDHHLNELVDETVRMQRQLMQMEKMAMLGQMVSGISHEINNPINFIYGNLPYVEEHVEDLLKVMQAYQSSYSGDAIAVEKVLENIELDFILEDLPRIMGSIKVGADRIRELVLTLRNFYRLDEAEMKPANIHEGIDSTLLLLHHRYKQEIKIIKEFNKLPLVECHINQINQVFMNLLSNAIDALLQTPLNEQDDASGGSSARQITITTQAVNDEWISISIADNGPGIAQEVQERIFEPFFTTKPIGVGTGLGLSISHQIITENHQGHLYCCSKSGNGTTFKVELPVKQTEPAD